MISTHNHHPTTAVFTPTGIAVGMLPVSDPQASAAFYGALFGLEYLREFSRDGQVTGCAVGRADLDFALAFRLREDIPGHPDLRGEHPLVWRVRDRAALEAFQARAVELGLEPTSGEHDDAAWVEVLDPDGIGVRVALPTPPLDRDQRLRAAQRRVPPGPSFAPESAVTGGEGYPAGASSQQVALVTGGTAGIGAAVAVEVARRGWRVLISGRDTERGAAMVNALRAAGPGGRHGFIPADLALMAATAQLGQQVLDSTTRLDAVVLCAGVLATRPAWTSEGLERCLAVNYLSRHLLLRLLQPRLLASTSGRVVLVANAGRYPDTLDLDDLQHRHGRAGLRVSLRTQFANDVLAVELSRRLQGTRVEVTCVYPGLVATDIFRNALGPSARLRQLATTLWRVVGRAPAEAAGTPVTLATDPDLVGVSGRFYGPRMAPRRVPPAVLSDSRREAIWNAADELVRRYVPDRSTR